MNTITLSRYQGMWRARYGGPHAADVLRLLGTVEIPTSFTSSADPELVRAEIQRLNPGVTVYLAVAE